MQTPSRLFQDSTGKPLRRILFVCLGNIIRSPLAEALFRHKTDQNGTADQYEADSAGMDGWHIGEAPDARMLRVAASHGLVYTHQARKVTRSDLDAFDLILAMDRENYQDLLSLANTPIQQAKIHLLREWDALGGPKASVPDPFYGGPDGFEEVYGVVDRSVDGLIAALKRV